jgi:hypothetical protein
MTQQRPFSYGLDRFEPKPTKRKRAVSFDDLVGGHLHD